MQELIQGLIMLGVYLVGMVALVQWKRDTSIANFTWGGGCLLLAWYSLLMRYTFLPRQLLVTALVTIWALRMVMHLYLRYTGHDPRFEALRQMRGFGALIINIVYMFGPQVSLLLVMSTPFVVINVASFGALRKLDGLWIGFWILGFLCEAIADLQLYQFTKNPVNKGHIMTSGLWRYSRHPNYFGEVVMWWMLFCIARPVPWGWTTIIAPMTITGLLLFVTGIPLVEAALKNNIEFQMYRQKTSAFIPWFVRD